MSNDSKKSRRELVIFRDFAKRSSLPIIPDSIENRCPPEPDILCRLGADEWVAFELKEICSPDLRKGISDSIKSRGQYTPYIRGTSEYEEEKINDAFEKNYETEHPTELLFYVGASFTFDDTIVPTIRDSCRRHSHRFRRVWFMGEQEEDIKLVWSVEPADEQIP